MADAAGAARPGLKVMSLNGYAEGAGAAVRDWALNSRSTCGTPLARARSSTTRRGRIVSTYGKKASDKVHKAVHEQQHGTLRSGSGKKVTSRKQAIAIGLSEARKAGAKVPRKRSA
ncbi:MAG: DUF6496 domain-containing protein [Burkholderiaceae bacterium]